MPSLADADQSFFNGDGKNIVNDSCSTENYSFLFLPNRFFVNSALSCHLSLTNLSKFNDDGCVRNIVNDFCATLDNYLFPYQFTPRRGAPRRRRGRAGGRLRRRPVSIAESVPHRLGVADTDTLEPSNRTNTIDSNQRRLRRSNLQTAPAQTSGSARALPTHIASRPSGAYQFPYSFGDINQLPPVGQVTSGNSHEHLQRILP